MDLTSGIPAYRLRDVGATIEAYDDQFRSNGHAVRVARGRPFRAGAGGHAPKSYDLLRAFLEVLGRPAGQAPRNFAQGELVEESTTDPEQLNDLYALVPFRPVVTKERWRMDCGVAAYDNTIGLPTLFPTRLREEVANLLKRKIRATLSRVDDLSIEFDYTGEVTLDDSEEILARVGAMYARVLDAERGAAEPERRRALQTFAANLDKAFYGFEPDFFQQNVARIVDDVVTQFHASLALWPTLVEICYFQRRRGGLPMTRVENRRFA